MSEVNTVGDVLRQFIGSRLSQLTRPPHVAVDSHGNVLVAESDNGCILLLDAQLTLRRVIVDKHQLIDERPRRLCYVERTGQLLIGLYSSVAVFGVLRRQGRRSVSKSGGVPT